MTSYLRMPDSAPQGCRGRARMWRMLIGDRDYLMLGVAATDTRETTW